MKFPKPSWVMIVRENFTQYEKEVANSVKANSSQSVADFLRPRLAREEVEVMVVLCLDAVCHIKYACEVARGATNGLNITAKEILRPVIISNASAFVIVHNHPSGDPTPSTEDIAMTKHVSEAAEIVGPQLVDHVIIAGSNHYSFNDHGLL